MEELFDSFSVVDENGKPEVSVALSDFTAFVGFRPPSQILAFTQQVAEFGGFFSAAQLGELTTAAETTREKGTEQSRDALRSLFGTTIALSSSKAKSFIHGITETLKTKGPKSAFGDVDDAEALARIWKKNLAVYGDSDVGLIVTTYLMNLLQLKAGEGCWILAGISSF